MEELTIKVDGKEYQVFVEETPQGIIKVHCGGDVYEVSTQEKSADVFLENAAAQSTEGVGVHKIIAPLPGIITEVNIKEGDTVKKGATLIKLIAMKMENEITSTKDGVIKKLLVKKDDKVNRGDCMAILE